MDGELIMAVSASDALSQAQILAMRSISDNVAILSRQIERIGDDAKITRESVVKLEAQDLKATILDVRREAMASIVDLRKEHDGRMGIVESRMTLGEVALARLRGTIVPLATLGSAILGGLLAFLGNMIANNFGRH